MNDLLIGIAAQTTVTLTRLDMCSDGSSGSKMNTA